MIDNRVDMTDWLIHFTKDVYRNDQVDIYVRNLNECSGEIEERLDYTNQFIPGFERYSAFECLKKILRECFIRYGYSFRNKRTTIYGGEPVICFTEMPLISLLEYSKVRHISKVSTYGIAILKRDAFNFGARPVISGLSSDNSIRFIENSNVKRIISSENLPIEEQYRYVPLELSNGDLIDWTHEREWRIRRRNDKGNYFIVEYDNELIEMEGLNIFDSDNEFKEIILIVSTFNEADEIYDLVLLLSDAGSNSLGITFNPESISILILERINTVKGVINRIEDLTPEEYFKISLPILTEAELLSLKEIINEAKSVITQEALTSFSNTTQLKKFNDSDYIDICGYSTIRCSLPRNKFLRGLIKLGFAFPQGDNYIIEAIGYTNSQSLTCNEFVSSFICDFLNNRVESIFYTQSHLD